MFGLRWAQKMKPCFVTLRTFFSSTAGQGFQNTKWPAVPYSQQISQIEKISRSELSNLQCRRILGGRNLVRVRNVVVAAIFDFMVRPISSSLREVSTCANKEQTVS